MIVDRILKIIELNQINKSQFYKITGLSNGFLDKVKDIGASKIEHILKSFPDINAEWLITGNGSMFKSNLNVETQPVATNRKTVDPIIESQRIPMFNLEATMGLVPMVDGNGIDEDKVIDYISIPNLPSCDGAIFATGDSMYPLLKAGDIIAYKNVQVDINNIFFGEIYLLAIYIDESTTFKTVKFVQKSELGDEYVKIVSQNQHHQSKDIKINQIASMALVRASIRLHN